MRLLLVLFTVVALLAAADGTRYTGEWKSTKNDNGGSVTMRLAPGPDALTQSSFTFTYNGQDVPTQIKALDLSADKLMIRTAFELGDYKLESTFRGARDGDKWSGTYQTKTTDDKSPVDEGTFTAAAAKQAGLERWLLAAMLIICILALQASAFSRTWHFVWHRQSRKPIATAS